MKEKVIDLIEEILNLKKGTLDEKLAIDDVEGWDSLAHVLIIGELESRLGVSIPLDEAIEIVTVADLLEKAGVK